MKRRALEDIVKKSDIFKVIDPQDNDYGKMFWVLETTVLSPEDAGFIEREVFGYTLIELAEGAEPFAVYPHELPDHSIVMRRMPAPNEKKYEEELKVYHAFYRKNAKNLEQAGRRGLEWGTSSLCTEATEVKNQTVTIGVKRCDLSLDAEGRVYFSGDPEEEREYFDDFDAAITAIEE